MSRLASGDVAIVRELTRSLEVLDLERPSALEALTPRLHRDLGIDCATAYSITAGDDGFLLCRGESNKAIASELGCAERTAEVHVSRILAKLDVDSRAAPIAMLLGEAGR